MLRYSTLFSFLIPVLFLSITATTTSTNNQALPSQTQPFNAQLDIQHNTSHLDQIKVPAYVSAIYASNHDNKRTTASDHSIISAISTSVQLCKDIGGEKGAATCSYLLIDRPWRQWRQKLSHYLHGIKSRYLPIIYNFLIKTFNHPYIDSIQYLQNKRLDWWKFPTLEWHILKSRLVTFWDRYYYGVLNWYLGKDKSYDDKNGGFSYYNNPIGSQLEPDQDGCYYDVLGTTLCMNEQRLLDNNGLNDRVNELFEAMTYEERSHTLRFQQRFMQWATKASSMTAEALDRTQSIWLQHTQTMYRFLDDALSLNPHTNDSKSDDHNQGPTTNQMNLCPPVVFPFSISPFDTSLKTAFFSLISHPQSIRSALPPTRSYLSLMPIQQPWVTCVSIQNDNSGVPDKTVVHLPEQPLDPYNKIQHQYLLTRLENEMMKQLERLEKTTLQEYYQAMVTAPHRWTLRRYAHSQQQHQNRQQLHAYTSGYAAQQLYQELRLYINISLRQLYQRSIQQLMDVTKQYDELVMKQVKRAYDEKDWIKKQQARSLFSFYPLHDETTNSNHHHVKETEESSPSYPASTIINTRAITFIGQRADWAVQAHRKTVLRQWKTIFEDMDRQSRSIWVSAMDQAQGRHRTWTNCSTTCTFLMDLVKLVIVVLFLLYL